MKFNDRSTYLIALWRYILLLFTIIGVAASTVASQAQTPAPADASNTEALEEKMVFSAVLKETCGRQIVLLGENGSHGEGKTIAFKARLVEQLLSRCGFKIVLFEASQFEFLDIERKARRGEMVTRAQIFAAIGQIWNQYQEMDGLISFLADAKNRSRFIIGGLDDQLGTRGLLFGNDAMIAELTRLLPDQMQQSCSNQLVRRTYYAYSRQEPYSVDVRDGLQACVAAIRQALVNQPQGQDTPFLRAMIDNIDRSLAHDFQPESERVAGRASSMYLNFR